MSSQSSVFPVHGMVQGLTGPPPLSLAPTLSPLLLWNQFKATEVWGLEKPGIIPFNSEGRVKGTIGPQLYQTGISDYLSAAGRRPVGSQSAAS